jgi:hypothetical protein
MAKRPVVASYSVPTQGAFASSNTVAAAASPQASSAIGSAANPDATPLIDSPIIAKGTNIARLNSARCELRNANRNQRKKQDVQPGRSMSKDLNQLRG